ncbi:hypothetical protein EEB14_38945 [Rhodococcus sp. WS4]|nr:hypothetical protein EEB14_38945 [Rhodococcus sp. WS4]
MDSQKRHRLTIDLDDPPEPYLDFVLTDALNERAGRMRDRVEDDPNEPNNPTYRSSTAPGLGARALRPSRTRSHHLTCIPSNRDSGAEIVKVASKVAAGAGGGSESKVALAERLVAEGEKSSSRSRLWLGRRRTDRSIHTRRELPPTAVMRRSVRSLPHDLARRRTFGIVDVYFANARLRP